MIEVSAAPDLETWHSPALLRAWQQVKCNAQFWGEVFPDDTSQHNVYAARATGSGQPVGGNHGWTTGFWSGMLWLAHEFRADASLQHLAMRHVESFATRLEQRVDVDHHDLGFLYTLSCVAAHRLIGDGLARQTALQAAQALYSRYLKNAQVIQAWGDLSDPSRRGRMIVDCLMNLPLLYWASQQQPELNALHHAAEAHARQAMRYLVRPDASTFHTYVFDPQSGAALRGETHQGYGHDSCWSRGQAWAIYGFTLNYAYSRNPALLETAQRTADYFLRHLPSHGVAYWDLVFAEGSQEPFDSSATAIAACGLLEMSRWLPYPAAKTRFEQGQRLVQALVRHCANPEIAPGRGLLLHGVYGKPQNAGVDECNLWGDYFYLEALLRLRQDWRMYW
jgi:unsaturated chondroitin disaccharide hydrolase